MRDDNRDALIAELKNKLFSKDLELDILKHRLELKEQMSVTSPRSRTVTSNTLEQIRLENADLKGQIWERDQMIHSLEQKVSEAAKAPPGEPIQWFMGSDTVQADTMTCPRTIDPASTTSKGSLGTTVEDKVDTPGTTVEALQSGMATLQNVRKEELEELKAKVQDRDILIEALKQQIADLDASVAEMIAKQNKQQKIEVEIVMDDLLCLKETLTIKERELSVISQDLNKKDSEVEAANQRSKDLQEQLELVLKQSKDSIAKHEAAVRELSASEATIRDLKAQIQALGDQLVTMANAEVSSKEALSAVQQQLADHQKASEEALAALRLTVSTQEMALAAAQARELEKDSEIQALKDSELDKESQLQAIRASGLETESQSQAPAAAEVEKDIQIQALKDSELEKAAQIQALKDSELEKAAQIQALTASELEKAGQIQVLTERIQELLLRAQEAELAILNPELTYRRAQRGLLQPEKTSTAKDATLEATVLSESSGTVGGSTKVALQDRLADVLALMVTKDNEINILKERVKELLMRAQEAEMYAMDREALRSNSKTHDLAQQLEEKEQHIAQLQAQLHAVPSESQVRKQETEVEDLRQLVEALRSDLKAAPSDSHVQRSSAEVTELRRQLEAMQSEESALQQELAARPTLAELQQKRQELVETRKRLVDLESDNMEHLEQLESQKEQMARMQQLLNSAPSDHQLARQEKEREALKEQVKTLQSELAVLTEELKTRQQELERLREQLDQAPTAQHLQEREEELAQLRGQLAEAHSNASPAPSGMQVRSSDAEREALLRQLESFQSEEGAHLEQLQAQEQELARLQQLLEAAPTDAQLQEKDLEVAEVKHELAEVKHELAAVQSREDAHLEQVQALEQEIARLQQLLDSAPAEAQVQEGEQEPAECMEHPAAVESASPMRSGCRALQMQLDAVQEVLLRTQAEHNRQVEALELELEAKDHDLSVKDRELSAKNHELSAKDHELSAKDRELSDAVAHMGLARAQVTALPDSVVSADGAADVQDACDTEEDSSAQEAEAEVLALLQQELEVSKAQWEAERREILDSKEELASQVEFQREQVQAKDLLIGSLEERLEQAAQAPQGSNPDPSASQSVSRIRRAEESLTNRNLQLAQEKEELKRQLRAYASALGTAQAEAVELEKSNEYLIAELETLQANDYHHSGHRKTKKDKVLVMAADEKKQSGLKSLMSAPKNLMSPNKNKEKKAEQQGGALKRLISSKHHVKYNQVELNAGQEVVKGDVRKSRTGQGVCVTFGDEALAPDTPSHLGSPSAVGGARNRSRSYQPYSGPEAGDSSAQPSASPHLLPAHGFLPASAPRQQPAAAPTQSTQSEAHAHAQRYGLLSPSPQPSGRSERPRSPAAPQNTGHQQEQRSVQLGYPQASPSSQRQSLGQGLDSSSVTSLSSSASSMAFSTSAAEITSPLKRVLVRPPGSPSVRQSVCSNPGSPSSKKM